MTESVRSLTHGDQMSGLADSNETSGIIQTDQQSGKLKTNQKNDIVRANHHTVTSMAEDKKETVVKRYQQKGPTNENKVSSKKNRKKVQEDEAFQRLNFLYQASHTVMASRLDKPDIAAYYGSIIFSIAKKTLLKLEPPLKRTICKGCQSLLIPGVTARVRVRKCPSPCVLWTCICCQTRRRFITRRGHRLWPETLEAVVS